jgi:hypothetical protein
MSTIKPENPEGLGHYAFYKQAGEDTFVPDLLDDGSLAFHDSEDGGLFDHSPFGLDEVTGRNFSGINHPLGEFASEIDVRETPDLADGDDLGALRRRINKMQSSDDRDEALEWLNRHKDEIGF